MHKEQQQYCESLKQRFPEYFKNKNVLDVGSLDINGNNRYLFENCQYTGLDLCPGKNVDVICPVHRYNPGIKYDVILSTEMLEHDKFKEKSLKRMFFLLNPNGLLIITAATFGRKEHGTYSIEPQSSPYTNDWYGAITTIDFLKAFDYRMFSLFDISISIYPIADIRFLGIKK